MRQIINHIGRNIKVVKNCLEEKVLDYWFTLEFLSQDKYPQKELINAVNGVKSLKTKLSKGEKGYKSTFDFFEIRPQDNLYKATDAVLNRKANHPCSNTKFNHPATKIS